MLPESISSPQFKQLFFIFFEEAISYAYEDASHQVTLALPHVLRQSLALPVDLA